METLIQSYFDRRASVIPPLSDSTLQERRKGDRRKSPGLTGQTPVFPRKLANGPVGPETSLSVQEGYGSIALALVSEREYFFDLVNRHCRDAAVNQFKVIPVKPELIADRLEQIKPDLILVDSTSASAIVTDCLNAIRKKDAQVKIALLYDDISSDRTSEIIEFSASGLIRIDAGSDLFQKAVLAIRRGELWLPHPLIGKMIDAFARQKNLPADGGTVGRSESRQDYALTPRETEVVGLIVKGLSNKDIARVMNLSPETVKKKLSKASWFQCGLEN